MSQQQSTVINGPAGDSNQSPQNTVRNPRLYKRNTIV